MSALQLFLNATKRKRLPLDSFTPFSIRFESIYCPRKQLDRFAKAFGNPNELPSFSFIAAFPVMTQCLIQSGIPSRLMGLIHISSHFSVNARQNWLLPTDIEVEIAEATRTEKGIFYKIETRLFQHDVLTITNINYMLDKSRDYIPNRVTGSKTEDLEIGKPLCSIAISLKTSLCYALLSRDFNPIHLHPWLAKKFGLQTVLIHGMFNAHYVLSRLKQHEDLNSGQITIEFNRPCFLPKRVFVKQYGERPEYGLFSRDNSERFLKITIGKQI